MTFFIGHRELGLAAQRNRAGYRSCLRVNSGGVIAAAIESKDAFGSGIVNDCIRVLAGGRRSQNLQRLYIKDRHRGVVAVSDEAVVQVGGYRDTAHTVGG